MVSTCCLYCAEYVLMCKIQDLTPIPSMGQNGYFLAGYTSSRAMLKASLKST